MLTSDMAGTDNAVLEEGPASRPRRLPKSRGVTDGREGRRIQQLNNSPTRGSLPTCKYTSRKRGQTVGNWLGKPHRLRGPEGLTDSRADKDRQQPETRPTNTNKRQRGGGGSNGGGGCGKEGRERRGKEARQGRRGKGGRNSRKKKNIKGTRGRRRTQNKQCNSKPIKPTRKGKIE